MSRPRSSCLGLLMVTGAVFLFSACRPVAPPGDPASGPVLASCTIFSATQDGLTLAGNNEDWTNRNARAWFLPPTAGKYGRVFFGFGGARQGGMNDQGLFYDWAALPTRSDIVFPADKPYYDYTLPEKILAECATVEEAIEMYEQYNYQPFAAAHTMLVDKTGASAIVEWGEDELVVIRKEGTYQVLANVNITVPSIGWYPNWRYNTADTMLQESDVSVDSFRAILDAVHQSGMYPTVYSNIYDLTHGLVYVYYFHDFDNEIVFDLEEELGKGEHVYELPSLFATPTAPAEAPAAPEASPVPPPVEASVEPSPAGEQNSAWLAWPAAGVASVLAGVLVWSWLRRRARG